jgi:xylulose-5-phosphate/fructose-6-phosphate phosphoketolase
VMSLHRLIYHRTNHDNIHVRVHKEEGTITALFGMTVLNDLSKFHLVMNTIGRLQQTGDKGISLKQQLKDKLIEHKQFVNKCGEDLRKICHLEVGRDQRKQTGVNQADAGEDVHDANDPK